MSSPEMGARSRNAFAWAVVTCSPRNSRLVLVVCHSSSASMHSQDAHSVDRPRVVHVRFLSIPNDRHVFLVCVVCARLSCSGELKGEEWETPKGALARLLLLDQFPRTVYR